MTLKELKSKVTIKPSISDKYLVTISYKGKSYSCFSINHYAFERITLFNESNYKAERFFYTLKNAYLTFFDECKAKNGLKISKN